MEEEAMRGISAWYKSCLCVFCCYYVVIMSPSAVSATESATTPTEQSAGSFFYELAKSLRSPSEQNHTIRHLNLIRVPKAGSTSLSVVARRMAGCDPPGPCCKYPGDPPGSCPERGLFDCAYFRKVLGCTGHKGDAYAIRSASVSSITILRDPVARSISAFNYPGMHHNSDCKGPQLQCFEAYLQDKRFSNVALKMFVGDFAYANVVTCNHTAECKHSLELGYHFANRFAFVGISEIWELSLLLLHHQFPSVPPNEAEFALGAETHSNQVVTTADNSSSSSSITTTTQRWLSEVSHAYRLNNQSSYLHFAKEVRVRYPEQLHNQSRYDIELYKWALERTCSKVHDIKLWEIDYVRSYWKKKVTHTVHRCSE